MTLKKSEKVLNLLISMKNKSDNDSPTLIIHEENFIADHLYIVNVF